jgi:hypothetical protein
MSVLNLVAKLFKPAADLVDDLHTSAEEKAEVRLRIYEAQAGVLAQVMDYESNLIKAQASVITAEATGHSWMQRNWRPLLMLTFGFTVVYNIAIQPLMQWCLLAMAPEVPAMPILDIPGWIGAAITTGIGGYVVGRSGEKIAQTLTNGGMNQALFKHSRTPQD